MRRGLWSFFCPLYHVSFIVMRCKFDEVEALLNEAW